MNKTLLVILISPTLLFSWEDHLTAKSDQSDRSSSTREDTKGSPSYQSQGRNQQKDDSFDRNQNRSQQRATETRDTYDQNRDWNQRTSTPSQNQRRDDSFDRKQAQDQTRTQWTKEQIKQRVDRWQTKARDWRKNYSDNRTRDHVFDDHFWNNFRDKHHDWRFDNNFQWHSRPNWSRVVVWLPWQWKQPIYYYYDNNNIYYTSSEDYSNLIPIDSNEQFIAEAVRIANGQYPISTNQSDWMPLGMFTIVQENDTTPKKYLSLAISKQGAVTGALFDTATNTASEIKGGIDPKSQRIAWKLTQTDWPIMETGLYNLTKDESTLLIHTSSNTTETKLLIKLDQ